MECDDDDGDPGAKMKIFFKSYKFYWDDDQWKAQLWVPEVGIGCTWPPLASYGSEVVACTLGCSVRGVKSHF